MQVNKKPVDTAKGWYTYDVYENRLIFKTPQPPVHLHPNFFHPLDLRCPILNESLTLSNKLWENNYIVHVNKQNQNKNKIK